jgi:hypothetical protein
VRQAHERSAHAGAPAEAAARQEPPPKCLIIFAEGVAEAVADGEVRARKRRSTALPGCLLRCLLLRTCGCAGLHAGAARRRARRVLRLCRTAHARCWRRRRGVGGQRGAAARLQGRRRLAARGALQGAAVRCRAHVRTFTASRVNERAAARAAPLCCRTLRPCGQLLWKRARARRSCRAQTPPAMTCLPASCVRCSGWRLPLLPAQLLRRHRAVQLTLRCCTCAHAALRRGGSQQRHSQPHWTRWCARYTPARTSSSSCTCSCCWAATAATRLHLRRCCPHTLRTCGRSRALACDLTALLHSACGAACACMRRVRSRSYACRERALLCIHSLDAVVRRDGAARASAVEFVARGARGTVLAEDVLEELAYKCGRSPKFGA